MSRGGRVLHAADGRVVVQLPQGRLITVANDDETLRAGDLVALAPEHLDRVWSHPTGEFPDPTSRDRKLHNPESWSVLGKRAALLRGIRLFFEERDFLEVETPLVVPSPGTEVHLAPTAVQQADRPGAEPKQASRMGVDDTASRNVYRRDARAGFGNTRA